MKAPIRGKYSKVAAIDQPANHFRMNDKSYIFNNKCIRNIRDIFYEQQLIRKIGICIVINVNNNEVKISYYVIIVRKEPRIDIQLPSLPYL